MSNLFVNEDIGFAIKIAIASGKDNTEKYCDLTIQTLKEEYGDDIDINSIEEHELYFRYPDFYIENIFDKLTNPENYEDSQNSKLVYLLRKWTFKDESGVCLPITRENILNLNRHIVFIIVLQVDAILQKVR